ncbi:hypothetical protein ACWZHB_20170 [Nocardia sp. FBN12]|uniref:hypothetical protein n=1 Tax=Nocardia sp. FBN12 TaxID=3419766 RepID=UPI003D057311
MYPAPAQRPATGGTAVTAAILALLGGLAAFGGVVMYAANTLRFDSPWFGWGIVPGWTSIVTVLLLVIDVVAAVMLLAGAALILRRRKAGPTLVILGCLGEIGTFVLGGLSTVIQLLDYGLPLSRQLEAILGNSSINLLLGADVDIHWAVSLFMMVFPVLTFVLAVLPTTRRWCRGDDRRPAGFGAPGMQPFPMPQPGMPQGRAYGAPQGQWPRPQEGYRPR